MVKTKLFTFDQESCYVYCPFCNLAYPGWDVSDYKTHPAHRGSPLNFAGVYIQQGFLNTSEEAELIDQIDKMPWSLSQSGRRKQNFGPKCNFKKHKLNLGDFKGFPKFSQFIQERFKNVEILNNFRTIEQCSLEYVPEKGSSIDPHVDDCWIWGERVVTVNLLSDSVLTMVYNKKIDYYNLDYVRTYPKVVNPTGESFKVNSSQNQIRKNVVVRIPMPRNSLIVLYDSARYDWEHQILREDIKERRVCIAYREFTPLYLPSGTHQDKGQEILKQAINFWETF